jgi:arylsulfatase A-like enzyme
VPGRRCQCLAAFAAACAALACAPSDERLAVTARVGVPEGRVARPAQVARKHTVAQETRDALVAEPGRTFEVDVQPGDRRLLFSLALGAPDGCNLPFVFSIAGRDTAGWRPVFQEAVRGQEPHWLDRSLDLDASGARLGALRFALQAQGGAVPASCRQGLDARWGSIVFLGRSTPPMSGAPNVLLLSLDTLGAANLGSFENDPAVSPNLDAFLESSFSFRRAYAQYGYTRPSHTSLFTGLYPVHHGVYKPFVAADFDSLVSVLAQRGYRTAAFTEGAMVDSALGFSRGFDAYHDGKPSLAQDLAGGAEDTFARAGRWLEQQGRDTRFFLFVHTYEVHLPYIPRDRAARAIARRLTPGVERFFRPVLQARATSLHNRAQVLLSPAELAHLHALHSAEIHFLDRVVARFLVRLRELGLEQDTLVVLLSDHGEQFGERGKVTHGESLHNHVLHVPLGFRWPGRIGPGASEEPVQIIDVMPTILDLVGIETSQAVDGRSLAPLLHGDALPPRPVFSEMVHGSGDCIQAGKKEWCRLDRFAVQDRRFKLITSRIPPRTELYDLEDDPLETRNVAAAHPAELERLSRLLRDYRAQADEKTLDAEGPPVPVDDSFVDLLEHLGYVWDGEADD